MYHKCLGARAQNQLSHAASAMETWCSWFPLLLTEFGTLFVCLFVFFCMEVRGYQLAYFTHWKEHLPPCSSTWRRCRSGTSASNGKNAVSCIHLLFCLRANMPLRGSFSSCTNPAQCSSPCQGSLLGSPAPQTRSLHRRGWRTSGCKAPHPGARRASSHPLASPPRSSAAPWGAAGTMLGQKPPGGGG